MRNKVFLQLNPEWSKLPYPNKIYTIGTSGCGCCSVTNVIIELSQYWEFTPKDVQPYMKQFAVPGQGTQWSGITKAFEHYGLKAKNPSSMGDLFKILNNLKKRKKKTMGVLLFCGPKDKYGNRLPATKGGVTWTKEGHYVAYTNYKYKNGKHYFYMKDSGPRHNTGWFCYESKMKGLIIQCYNAQTKTTTGGKLCVQASKTFKEMHELGFKYSVSGNANSWKKAKKKKTSNCATYASYNLQIMKLLKDGQIFYCSKRRVNYKGDGTKKQLEKISRISSPNKPPKKCQLHKGDICGYDDPAHTQIFYKYDNAGNALWYSFGPSDLWKKMPRKRGDYNKKRIRTIIRLK